MDDIALQPDYRFLGEEEKRLFWRYRYSQAIKKEVLVKFMQSVNWQKTSERDAGLELMKNWAEIDLE